MSLLKRAMHEVFGRAHLSVNRRIFAAAVTVGSFTLVVKLVSVVKELVVAYDFGTSRELDALLIAFAVPTLGINVLGGSIQAALIPAYLETLQRQGRDSAHRLLGLASSYYLCLLIIVTFLLLIGTPWILDVMTGGFSADSLLLTRHLYYWLLPVLLVTGYARFVAAVLVAEDHYAIATVSSVATPVISITMLLLFVSSLGIYALMGGYLVGAVAEVLLLLYVLRTSGVRFRTHWGRRTAELSQVGHQYFPMLAGMLLMSGMTITDQAMAALLPAGGVAALNYANKVPSLIINLTSTAIGTALLPYLSRSVAVADWNAVRHVYRTYARLIFAVTIPVTILLVALSWIITRQLFQHGAFTSESTHVVAMTQACMLLEIPFYTVGILAVRMIAALKKTHVLVWGAVISLALNVTLNYLFMQVLGVAGIALSTTVVYVVSMIYLLFMSKRYIATASNAGGN